jgi:hypothetical protein
MVISEGLEGVTGATPGPGIAALSGVAGGAAPSEPINLLAPSPLRDGADARGRAAIPQTSASSAARITPEQGFNPATQTPAPEQPPVISGTDDGAGAVAATSPETLRRDTAPEPQAAIPMAMPMPQMADNGAAEPHAPEAATRAAQGAAARTEEARAEGAGLPQAAVNQMQQASSLLAGGEALRAAVAAALLGQSP